MAMTMTDLKSFSTRYRVHAEAIGVALFAFVVFAGLGIAARRKLAPARTDEAAAAAVDGEISSFRAAFKAAPTSPDVMATLPDSFAIDVPRDDRVSLAGNLASRAELVGLSDVRVKFALPDSSAAPDHPDLFSTTVAVADYSVSIECAGSFASVLSLVNQLPPSVALQRITAVRDKTGSHFRLMLAVFESARAAQHG
jgi:hypothetical protein